MARLLPPTSPSELDTASLVTTPPANSPPASLLKCTIALLVAELAWAVGMLLEAVWQSGSSSDADNLKAFSVGEEVASWAAVALPALRVTVARMGAALGANDLRAMRAEACLARLFAYCTGLPITLMAALMAWPLIHYAFELPESAAKLALPYTEVHLIGNAFMYVLYANTAIMQGMQHVNAYAVVTVLKTAYMLLSNWLMVNELHMGALGSGIASASRNALLMAVTSLYIRLAVPQLRGVQEQREALSAGNGAGSGTRSRCCCPVLPLNWRGFGTDAAKLFLAALPASLIEMAAAAIASRQNHPGADVILRRVMYVPAAVESALLSAALVVTSRAVGSGDASAQLKYMTGIMAAAVGLGLVLAVTFYPLRQAVFAAFEPPPEVQSELETHGVWVVVLVTCLVGPIASAAQGIAYSTRRFGAIAIINWAGLAAFAPSMAVAAKYAPGSLAATRAAYLSTLAVSLVGCSALACQERSAARRKAAASDPNPRISMAA